MAKMTMKTFEKSKADKEPKGMKEGSKADKALDKKQFASAKKMGMKTPKPMVPKGKPTSDKVKGGKGNAAKKFA